MHHGAAGIVEHAELGAQPAARRPHPMGDGAIDDQRPQDREDDHRREFHAVGEGAGDQGRGDDGEGHLEHHIDALGDGAAIGVGTRRPQDAAHRAGLVGADHVLQEQGREIAEIGVLAMEGQRIAEHEPQHGDQAGDDEALHHRRQDVLLAHHAGIEQRQAGNGHHQHEGGRDQHPGGMAGVQMGRRRRGGIGGGILGEGHAGHQQRSHRGGPETEGLGYSVHHLKPRHNASLLVSPVRMRIACTMSKMKILPSPILPVWAAD